MFSKTVQNIFIQLESLYVRKNKLVTILNKMKRSDHTYWDSMSMDYPIYSIPNAETCLKDAKQHFENYVAKQNRIGKPIHVKQMIKNSDVDKWSELLSKVSRAKKHLEFCQKKYQNYKQLLSQVNSDIRTVQKNLYETIEKEKWIVEKFSDKQTEYFLTRSSEQPEQLLTISEKQLFKSESVYVDDAEADVKPYLYQKVLTNNCQSEKESEQV